VKPQIHVDSALWCSLKEDERDLLRNALEYMFRRAYEDESIHSSTTHGGFIKVETGFGSIILSISLSRIVVEDFVIASMEFQLPFDVWMLTKQSKSKELH
jgi:hypothetical protein